MDGLETEEDIRAFLYALYGKEIKNPNILVTHRSAHTSPLLRNDRPLIHPTKETTGDEFIVRRTFKVLNINENKPFTHPIKEFNSYHSNSHHKEYYSNSSPKNFINKKLAFRNNQGNREDKENNFYKKEDFDEQDKEIFGDDVVEFLKSHEFNHQRNNKTPSRQSKIIKSTWPNVLNSNAASDEKLKKTPKKDFDLHIPSPKQFTTRSGLKAKNTQQLSLEAVELERNDLKLKNRAEKALRLVDQEKKSLKEKKERALLKYSKNNKISALDKNSSNQTTQLSKTPDQLYKTNKPSQLNKTSTQTHPTIQTNKARTPISNKTKIHSAQQLKSILQDEMSSLKSLIDNTIPTSTLPNSPTTSQISKLSSSLFATTNSSPLIIKKNISSRKNSIGLIETTAQIPSNNNFRMKDSEKIMKTDSLIKTTLDPSNDSETNLEPLIDPISPIPSTNNQIKSVPFEITNNVIIPSNSNDLQSSICKDQKDIKSQQLDSQNEIKQTVTKHDINLLKQKPPRFSSPKLKKISISPSFLNRIYTNRQSFLSHTIIHQLGRNADDSFDQAMTLESLNIFTSKLVNEIVRKVIDSVVDDFNSNVNEFVDLLIKEEFL